MKKLLLLVIAALPIVNAAQTIPSYVPTNGLVGWWPFNGNANDESGNGNNGAVNGATLTNDRNGNSNSAYSFDGINDYIQTSGISFGGGSNYTISFWAKLNVAYSNGYPQHWILDNGVQTNGIYFNTDFNEHQFGCNSLFYNNNVSVWHHFVAVKTGSTHTLYIDTSNVGMNTNCSANFINNNSIFIGCSSLLTEHTNGSIDDIGIWNRILTQQEIFDLYNGQNCQISITTQPSDQSLVNGASAIFTTSSGNPNASYQWQTDIGLGFLNLNNAGQYSGVNTATLTVNNISAMNNNQAFRCIVSDGACSDTTNTAFILNTTGIDQSSFNNNISVSPNPAHELINISWREIEVKTIRLYDSQGRLLQTLNVSGTQTQINLQGIDKGIYYLCFDGKNRVMKKVIVD